MSLIDHKEFYGYFQFIETQKPHSTQFALHDSINENTPSGILDIISDVVRQLVQSNGESVKDAIRSGERRLSVLFDILSDWESASRKNHPELCFLGLRITTQCNLVGNDRCMYCDQKQYGSNVLSSDLICDMAAYVSHEGKRRGIRATISGGEPLLLGNDYLFTSNGIIPVLRKYGFITNLNSNLHLVSPRDILPIINSGLTCLHTSLDSSDDTIHDMLSAKGAYERVITSLLLFQDVKERVNSTYPSIHINIVATKHNLRTFDDFFSLVLKLRSNNVFESAGNTYSNPIKYDMDPHLITVGGESNISIRPSYEDWQYYVDIILPRCKRMWQDYLQCVGVVPVKSNEFDSVFAYMDPFRQGIFENNINYDERIKILLQDNGRDFETNRARCHISPTQLYIVPNGDCYPCGTHADENNAKPIGNIYNDNYMTIIEKNMKYYKSLPNKELCKRCIKSARSTNAMVSDKLKMQIRKWLSDSDGSGNRNV